MLAEAMADPEVRTVTAATAVDNVPSQRALEQNGFSQEGRGFDPDGGEILLWRKDLNV